MRKPRSQSPVRYEGKRGTTWKARYVDRDGRRLSAGSFAVRGPCDSPRPDGNCCAQHAIDAAHARVWADARGIVEPAAPVILVGCDDAARMLAMDADAFDTFVLPCVKVIRRGDLVLVPVTELERWVDENAEYTLVVH